MITTSTALTTIAFWFYEIFLPGPPHPYIGVLVFLILPAIFVLGLLLMPFGIWLRRRSLRGSGQLPAVFPAIDLRPPVVQRTLEGVVVATALNLLIIGTASYRGVEYLDSTNFCGTTCHVMLRNRVSSQLYEGQVDWTNDGQCRSLDVTLTCWAGGSKGPCRAERAFALSQ